MNDAFARSATAQTRTDESMEETNEEYRAWTIRNIDSDVIERSRAAARQKGMKIGAWVTAQLRHAAEQDLGAGGQGISEAAIRELYSLVSTVASLQSEESSRLRRIEDEVNVMLKAQNGILCHLLKQKQD